MTVSKNQGFAFPIKRLTVNLAPADLLKQSPAYDLPMAVGILWASEQVSPLSSSVFIGELSLDGSVRHADGILPMVSVAKEEGFQRVFAPLSDAPEASLIGGLEIIPLESLSQLVAHLNGSEEIPVYVADPEVLSAKAPEYSIDFAHIRGQEHVKRALEVAAAGGHNVLMSGPPALGVSPNPLNMLPFIFTIIVLLAGTGEVIRKRIGAPSALGIPYAREKK